MDIVNILKEFKLNSSTLKNNKIWIGGGYVRDKLAGLTEFHDYDIIIQSGCLVKIVDDFCNFLAKTYLIKRPKLKTLAASQTKQRTAMIVKVNSIKINSLNLSCDFSCLPVASDEQIPFELLKDAERRDYTMNALYYDIDTDEVIDPLGMGMAHLENGILDCPISPKETLMSDPVRIIRGARLIAKDPRRKFSLRTCEAIFDTDVIQAFMSSTTATDRIAAETNRLLKLESYRAGLDVFRDHSEIIKTMRDSLVGENSLCWMRRQMLDQYISQYFHVNDTAETIFFALPAEQVGS